MQPKVSIIVPCWGVEKYLDRCVESLVNQTLRDIEIILVDDESPDRVPEMCDEWALRDERIKVVHKKNGGLGMACNSGIEAATGTYVAFCDSDDWVDADMYETMYKAAEEHHAQAVYTGLKRVDEKGTYLSVLPHKNTKLLYNGSFDISRLAGDMIASEPCVSSERSIQMSAKVVLYRRDTIVTNHIRFISERQIMSEDLHFNLSFLSRCETAIVLPVFFYNYRCNPSSITQKLDLSRFSKIKVLYEYTSKETHDLGFVQDLSVRAQRMFIGYTRSYLRTTSRAAIAESSKLEVFEEVLQDSIWNSIWASYPSNQMNIKNQMLIFLMRRKCSNILKVILKFF